MSHLSPESVEALGSYVYALIDPRKNQSDPSRVFYVGKGKGQRCFTHADDELKSVTKDEPNPKLQLIREIRVSTGAPPPIEIVAHRLDSEEALRVEAVLIKLLNTDGNLASGKYTAVYWQSYKQIEGRYSDPLSEDDLGHRVLLVSLNGSAKGEAPCRRFLRSWTATCPDGFSRIGASRMPMPTKLNTSPASTSSSSAASSKCAGPPMDGRSTNASTGDPNSRKPAEVVT